MKKVGCISLAFTLIVLNACSITQKNAANKKLIYNLQGGLNVGGIVDNTDLSKVPNHTDNSNVDAYSGATKLGLHAGMHIKLPLKINQLESGVDIMYNDQTFTYNDLANNYIGSRDVITTQLMIPFTYNVNFLTNSLPKADLQFKLGLVGQANFAYLEHSGNIPDYSVNRFSGGFTFGFSGFLFKLKNEKSLGWYCDVYRGSQIYEDFYNQVNFEMPGSSYVKFGISCQFK